MTQSDLDRKAIEAATLRHDAEQGWRIIVKRERRIHILRLSLAPAPSVARDATWRRPLLERLTVHQSTPAREPFNVRNEKSHGRVYVFATGEIVEQASTTSDNGVAALGCCSYP